MRSGETLRHSGSDYTIGASRHGTLSRRGGLRAIVTPRRQFRGDSMPLIDPGQTAPPFSLPDQQGKVRSLKDFAGAPLVLYFYPKDDTPGCTKEACTFQSALPDFRKVKATVLGVSVLDSASKAKFATKFALTFPLLADEDHAVADRYGAWQQKSMYGKKYMGVARISYLIDAKGKVVKRWDSVKPDIHAGEVLAALRELAS